MFQFFPLPSPHHLPPNPHAHCICQKQGPRQDEGLPLVTVSFRQKPSRDPVFNVSLRFFVVQNPHRRALVTVSHAIHKLTWSSTHLGSFASKGPKGLRFQYHLRVSSGPMVCPGHPHISQKKKLRSLGSTRLAQVTIFMSERIDLTAHVSPPSSYPHSACS